MSENFVLDCSVTMAWCFRDQSISKVDALLESMKTRKAFVPSIWSLEVSNVLLSAERRKKISGPQSASFMALLSELQIQEENVSTPTVFRRIHELAKTHGLSSYDAAYLDLAVQSKLALATLDDALRRAAKLAGVSLII